MEDWVRMGQVEESCKCPLQQFIATDLNLDIEFMSTDTNLDSVQSPLERCFVVIKMYVEKIYAQNTFSVELLESPQEPLESLEAAAVLVCCVRKVLRF